ncbi:hypothetical protein CHH28_16755 [Bacterioplanes sanyensis]|uniref:Uncharacterized protein n=1 Tax=Bacterioplanes sanyensis TaxID=1249553 RepID=A0A222FMG8_9GAMM|nr:hypothetical protein CHH28_16755 [Bacterioplanes sanyensis]
MLSGVWLFSEQVLLPSAKNTNNQRVATALQLLGGISPINDQDIDNPQVATHGYKSTIMLLIEARVHLFGALICTELGSKYVAN